MRKQLFGKKWIVAVSGGPDSMALLDICVQQGIDVVAAHVNYHKRITANRDQRCLQNYCQKYHLKMMLLQPKQVDCGNFQAWARCVRYDFFKACVESENAYGLLVGHHEDDAIETYLLQKNRKSIPEVYGIAEKTNYQGMHVVRPLLRMSKKECVEYCVTHEVPFGIDESNLTNDYTRNKIRHDIVECMTRVERKEILNEIKLCNQNKRVQTKKIDSMVKGSQIDCDVFKLFDEEDRLLIIRHWLRKQQQTEHKKSRVFLKQIDLLLCSPKNHEVELNHGILSKSYTICEIVGKEDKRYLFVIQSIHDFETPFFEMSTRGDRINAVSVKDSDFPLTIRNVEKNDAIKLRIGTKKINRWFIDRKIPMKDRKAWPVVLNKQGEVILVPGIGCNVEHYTIKPNLFVVKY